MPSLSPHRRIRNDSDLFGRAAAEPAAQRLIAAALQHGLQTREAEIGGPWRRHRLLPPQRESLASRSGRSTCRAPPVPGSPRRPRPSVRVRRRRAGPAELRGQRSPRPESGTPANATRTTRCGCCPSTTAATTCTPTTPACAPWPKRSRCACSARMPGPPRRRCGCRKPHPHAATCSFPAQVRSTTGTPG
jgi:hypothetical protein